MRYGSCLNGGAAGALTVEEGLAVLGTRFGERRRAGWRAEGIQTLRVGVRPRDPLLGLILDLSGLRGLRICAYVLRYSARRVAWRHAALEFRGAVPRVGRSTCSMDLTVSGGPYRRFREALRGQENRGGHLLRSRLPQRTSCSSRTVSVSASSPAAGPPESPSFASTSGTAISARSVPQKARMIATCSSRSGALRYA